MRVSQLFGATIREEPADAELPSHRLLLRAGYIRQLSAGIFSLLPLGQRSVAKIASILRNELDAIGGQEVSMPVVHPAELWQQSGRWDAIDETMVRFRDRRDHEMLLAMTHEEVVAALAASEVTSHRDLPRLVYQIQTKFRDEARPRAGLIRAREFVMKDSYSLDRDETGMVSQYRAHQEAYLRIFARVGLPVTAVLSDVGEMGGAHAHEFMYLSPAGEDQLCLCRGCGYSANLEVANFERPAPEGGEPMAVAKVATPAVQTIEALASLLDLPRSRLCKAVFMAGRPATETSEVLIMALVRGDMEVSLAKLRAITGAPTLRAATEAEIRAVGAVPGYASAIGLKDERLVVVADDSVATSTNLVAGANEEGFHLLNTCLGRDYEVNAIGAVAEAWEGAGCPNCGEPLELARGIEVGNIFQLGTRYSKAFGAMYADESGDEKPIWMGSYGIGLGRLLACVAEEWHDDRGLSMPASVAPFDVALVSLGGEKSAGTSENLYAALVRAGVETLWDDRQASAGVKFADADLRGMPVRLTVSDRSIRSGGVELKPRDSDAAMVIPIAEVVDQVRSVLDTVKSGLRTGAGRTGP